MGLLHWLGLDMGCEKAPVSLTDENFEAEVLKSPLPVIVDVWGEGCAPCVALAPTIKRLACKYEGKVKVCELNASQSPRLASKLGVRGTPTVLFFKDRSVRERVVGMRGQHYYEEILADDFGVLDPTQGDAHA